MNWYRLIIYGIAVFGEFLTAVRVLPDLWNSNPLDAVVVGVALVVMATAFVSKGLYGRWMVE